MRFVSLLLIACTIASFAADPLPFSPFRKAGPTLYVSGQVAVNQDGKRVTENVEAETRQVMENIKRILEENGYSFDHVVMANVYLRNIDDYRTMNKVYRSYFGKDFPARATVGGQGLVPGYNVEISVIAYKE